MNGRVLWFQASLGYGFIRGEDGKDYFVHWSNIIADREYKTLHASQEVSFNVLDGEAACNVKVVQRQGPNGKHLMLVSYIIHREPYVYLRHLDTMITTMRDTGLSYFYTSGDFLLAAEDKISQEEVEAIKHIIFTSKSAFAYSILEISGLQYDIQLV